LRCSYLVIAPTFDDEATLRVGKTALSIFGIVLFALGYICTFVLYFLCRSWAFQADAIFLYESSPLPVCIGSMLTFYCRPSLTSSSLGLLTILYTFLVNSHTTWNTVPILSLVVATVSTLFYSLLLLFTHHKIAHARARETLPTQNFVANTSYPPDASSSSSPPNGPAIPFNGGAIPWQSPAL
jgi:hypothetical protein